MSMVKVRRLGGVSRRRTDTILRRLTMMPIVMRLAGSASAVGSWVFRAALLFAVVGSFSVAQHAGASSVDAEYVVSDMPAASAPAAENVFVNGIRAQDEIILVNVRPLGS